ncbi:MAG: hypothetical protein KBC64_06130 [Simkaniaceae bacterium]|nr:hypothetical protein [Simkaniaceae bacterium]
MSPSIAAYDHHSLTRHLSLEERIRLETAIRTVASSSIDALCANLASTTPFKGTFWDSHPYTKWPLVAFAAFKAERCSVEHFTTISLLFAALKEFGYRRVCYRCEVVDDSHEWTGTWHSNPFSLSSIEIVLPSSPKYDKYLGVFFKWTPEWILKLHAKIVEELRAPADCCLIVLKNMPLAPLEYWGPMIKAVRIATNGVLYPFKERGVDVLRFAQKRTLVLPAFPVLKFLSTWGNEKLSITMKPALGTMTARDITEDRMEFSHVVALGMEELPLPDHADGRPTGPFTFALHDIYHTYTLAFCFSYELTMAINRMLQVLYKLEDEPILIALKSRLIDAEFKNKTGPQGFFVRDLFTNDMMQPYWDANGGRYKKQILHDIAKHRPFWDTVIGSLGLLPEDNALASSHPSPSWPPVAECIALNLKKEWISVLELGEIAGWTNDQISQKIKALALDPDLYLLNDEFLPMMMRSSPHFKIAVDDELKTFETITGHRPKFTLLMSLLSRDATREIVLGSFESYDLIDMLTNLSLEEWGALIELTEFCNWSKSRMRSVSRCLMQQECIIDPLLSEMFPENTVLKGMELERTRYLLCFECLKISLGQEKIREILFLIERLTLSQIVRFHRVKEWVFRGYLTPVALFQAISMNPKLMKFLEDFASQIQMDSAMIPTGRFFYFQNRAEGCCFEMQGDQVYVVGNLDPDRKPFLQKTLAFMTPEGNFFSLLGRSNIDHYKRIFDYAVLADPMSFTVVQSKDTAELISVCKKEVIRSQKKHCCSVQ